MSVDIIRLSGGLDPKQLESVRTAYSARAKNPTAAFLFCFFLGIFGAHRFYLGQTGKGVVRLILSPLIIPGLIWEIVDLFRIDGEVYDRNLRLAEELVARTALAQPNAALDAEAVTLLDTAVRAQEAAEQSLDAPAMAAPDLAGADAVPPPSVALESPLAPAADTTLVVAPQPQITFAPDLLDADPASVALPRPDPILAEPDLWDGTWDQALPAQPPGLTADEFLARELPDDEPLYAAIDGAPVSAPVTSEAPSEGRMEEEIAGLADLSLRPAGFDPTASDAGSAASSPVADIGEGNGPVVRVSLPEPAANAFDADIAGAASWVAPLPPSLASPPEWPDLDAGHLRDVPHAAAAEGAPDPEETPTLIFYPDDAGDPLIVSASAAAPADALPITSASDPKTDPAALADPADQAPASADVVQPGGGTEQVLEEATDQPVDGGHRVVKRVRVVRRLMVNGQVVQESSAEQVVDPDADTATTAAALRESLGTVDSETLAELANQPAPATPPSAGNQTTNPADAS